MQIRDAVVLVTGASSGIGFATARYLAARGAVVVGVARREERLLELESELRSLSPRSFTVTADLSEGDAPERIVAQTLARLGRIDVLVNNAAVSKHKHLWHTSPAEAEAVMRVNFLASVRTTFAVLAPMLRQGRGTVVNISSIAARIVPPRESLYAASKAALDAFTEGLWSDLDGSGIHAGLVVVGAIDTEIWEKLDEPTVFRGRKHPPEVVSRAILDVIEKRHYQVMAPRRSVVLGCARALRALAPGLVRFALRRMDPAPPRLLAEARARAEQGRGPGRAPRA